jgi:hypothetical protein
MVVPTYFKFNKDMLQDSEPISSQVCHFQAQKVVIKKKASPLPAKIVVRKVTITSNLSKMPNIVWTKFRQVPQSRTRGLQGRPMACELRVSA